MIVETENLTRRFGAKEAVRGISLAVPKGAAVALVGANGAGKTTTIRLIMNLLRPDGGEARVLGVDSRRLGPKEYARIGYVSENQRLPGALTVGEFFAYLRPLYPAWDGGLEHELRERLDLPDKARVGRLSHGMRIKCALAAALAYRPELLVLDEPLSGLDPLVRDQLMESLLRQAGETTVLISSHELSEIEGAVTDVAFIEAGRLKFQEPIEALRERFCEVTVTLEGAAGDPKEKPEGWFNFARAGSQASFVCTRFQGEAALKTRVTGALGPVRTIEMRPMSLRAISKALIAEEGQGRRA